MIETEQERIQSRMRLFDALTQERPSARAKRAKRRLGLSI